MLARYIRFIALIFLLPLSALNSLGQSISAESTNLAKCEGVYVYLAHLSQMQNNEGLAKNLLYRSSRVVAAYLFLNESGGKVKGEVMEQIKSVRRAEKPSLDADPNGVILKASECDKSTPNAIAKARNMNKVWDGKNYDEWQQLLFAQYMKTLGIK